MWGCRLSGVPGVSYLHTGLATKMYYIYIINKISTLNTSTTFMSRTVISGDFPARVRRSWAIIRSLLERTTEPAQAEPDTSSVGHSLERRSPSVHRRSRPESFGLWFNTFRSSLFMFPLIPLFVSFFPLLIPSHLSSLVLP
jgi:hypothetical protein